MATKRQNGERLRAYPKNRLRLFGNPPMHRRRAGVRGFSDKLLMALSPTLGRSFRSLPLLRHMHGGPLNCRPLEYSPAEEAALG
jgi:hypothetical protein